MLARSTFVSMSFGSTFARSHTSVRCSSAPSCFGKRAKDGLHESGRGRRAHDERSDLVERRDLGERAVSSSRRPCEPARDASNDSHRLGETRSSDPCEQAVREQRPAHTIAQLGRRARAPDECERFDVCGTRRTPRRHRRRRARPCAFVATTRDSMNVARLDESPNGSSYAASASSRDAAADASSKTSTCRSTPSFSATRRANGDSSKRGSRKPMQNARIGLRATLRQPARESAKNRFLHSRKRRWARRSRGARVPIGAGAARSARTRRGRLSRARLRRTVERRSDVVVVCAARLEIDFEARARSDDA